MKKVITLKRMYNSLRLYLLVFVSVLLFICGFFPLPNTTEQFMNEPPNHINNITLKKQNYFIPVFKKAVLIVIDALRFDFVTPDLMPLTFGLVIENGCISKVKVEAPTVTLPRVKALTSGNIPQFIDVVLNLMGTDILQDSLIHSADKSGKKVIFYGDDTWLKLFPNKFLRYEGTNSFFVRDFKEVDDNVTRNINIELENGDWDIMILHYLGLDHIGHVYGPFSSFVPEKLREMDQIVQKIYEKMSTKSETLLVVTGDHGMRDSGGHGGSTYSETNVPLLLMGLQCENSSFLQTDIPVNLAILLGLSIPSSAIGKVQKSMLPFGLEKYLYVLRYNCLLLKQKSSICDDHLDLATSLHETYLMNSNQQIGWRATELYEKCSEMIRDTLIKSSVEQSVSSLIISMLVMLNVLIMLYLKIVTNDKFAKLEILKIWYLFLSIAMGFCLVFGPILFLIILISFTIFLTNLTSLKKIHFKFPDSISSSFIVFNVIHPITFLSSSFIEEEHQFWYFLNILFIFIFAVNMLKHNFNELLFCCILLIAFRFLRTINSTGDKWANIPDFSDWLLKESNKCMYQLHSSFGFLLSSYAQYKLVNSQKPGIHIANFIIMLLIFVFKNYESNTLAKIIWLLLLSHALIFNKCSKIVLWIFISVLLMKPYNIILIPYCIFSSLFFSKYLKTIESLVLYHICLGNMLYFAQGHSNSLASVDISVGYIGLDEYKPILVIGQVICHTFISKCFVIFW
ncbi:phosphatidylinositol glycan anchor biosynthesis class G [Leptinotarsa decemlineata]|uniref:phosphatidylinositol glycan anchor biosynthesis class G n=1 Tax=Leptinotarsa decemlineata TaxID=7539 RepID=UPI003D306029